MDYIQYHKNLHFTLHSYTLAKLQTLYGQTVQVGRYAIRYWL